MSKEITAICNYCKKTNLELDVPIITGAIPGACICKKCIETINNSLMEFDDEEEEVEIDLTDNLKMKPSEIKARLDEYVIGQDLAKKKLATGVYNHYKRMRRLERDNYVEIEKSNILMVGPTGSGKTYFIKTLAKFLDVPCAISDATNLTQAGYVGEDPENILRKLIEAANGDIEKAQRGIIYIDEIDKLGRKGENVSISRDVSGEGVQQALLKIVEGTIAEVPPKGGRKHPNEECMKIDTTNILFIIGGSFEGIEKIISKRTIGEKSIGFGAKVVNNKTIEFNQHIDKVSVEDLKKFGMIPEFLGRFPVIIPLKELTVDQLKQIMTEPKNALTKQYQALMEEDNIDLKFSEEAIELIAKLAIERKTGARGLRGIVEEALEDVMFTLPDSNKNREVIINADTVKTKEAEIKLLIDTDKEGDAI